MLRSARNLLLACALGACGAASDEHDVDGTWVWLGDGGCDGAGERLVIEGERLRWIAANGSELEATHVTIRAGVMDRDRTRRWLEFDYARDGRQTVDYFTVTDRLGVPVLQLDQRTVDGSADDASRRLRDRLERCDG